MPLTLDQLRRLFVTADVEWVFDEKPDARAKSIVEEMGAVDRIYHEKLGRQLTPPLGETLLGDSEKFKALIQTFASPMTPEIRTMAFCVLEGADVVAVTLDYRLKEYSRLKVTVEYESGEKATFASDDVWDVEAIRHFGLMKLSGAPVIDGFYALRKTV